MPAVITIDVDPYVRIGPLELAWHGIMIAVGLAIGSLLAIRYAREIGLERGEVLNLVAILALSGIVGSRLLYLIQNEPGALARPADWLGTRGFAFYGALIGGVLAAGIYARRARLSVRYLDALAAGFPLGMAVGRIGDVINGEHFGPPTAVPWGVRYLHPGAETPAHAIAYHSGGLYEVVLALGILAVIWPLRRRFRTPTLVLWTVVALYGAGRFVMFFYRNDTEPTATGLNVAQLESLALLGLCALGAWWAARRTKGETGPRRAPARRAV